ncbi:uncharacterized protein [Nicotiana tomentosiformis]|uniref:uncharacterized protein n=1 Tax=Nicotiana tomentosiformis TaxID=4098 RepID=UPI00388CA2EC
MPKFDPYDGHRDLMAHLRGFCSNMRGAGGKDELLMEYFSQSLSGAALEWYTRQDTSRWREQAARVYPPMEEDEMVEYFLQALEPTYFGHLISAIGKSFNDVVKMGGIVEEGLKSSKIMSYSAIKATTQAIQNGTGSLLGKKKKEDIAMFVSGSWRGPRGPPHQYTQTRPQPQAYTQAPYNPSQHYLPPQDPRYSVGLSQYHVHHAQSYAQPPPYPQWHAPTPQNPYTPPQPYQNPTGPSFRPRPDYRKERQQRKETFTPLGESYTNLFQRLRQLDVLRPIEPKVPNPPPRNLDYSLRCAYCSDAPGHDTEKCWHLKRAIQELIDTNKIVFQSPEAPNINQNPLPAHAETHMIEIVHKDGEPKNSSKSVMMIRASESNPIKALDSAKAMPLTVKGVSEKPSALTVKPSVLVVKGPPIDVEANQEKQKVVVPGVLVDNGSSANICPLSTLQKLKIGTERIHINNVCVRGFDGGGKDFVGDIMLKLSIGPVEFTMEFQVLDMAVSYNLLLGRPWIHAAKAIPSSLHQMVKFEWERQKIVVHGDESLSTYNDTIVPFTEVEDDKGPWVYQMFETVFVEKIPE